MKSDRGIGEARWTEERIKTAFERLNHCSAGLDWTTKKLFPLFFTNLLPLVYFLFCQLASACCTLQCWRISIVVSVKKKGLSLTGMDNFREIHLLSCLRQWFVAYLLVDLENVANEPCCRVYGINQPLVGFAQQGSLKGRKMYSAILSIYALIESSWRRDKTLFII